MNPDRPTIEEVWRMLEAVIDPELHSSVVDLGMVRDVAVDEEGLISVEIALTIASCPLRSQIEGDVESRLRGLPGATGVEIRTTAMSAPERANLMAKARKQAAERAPETEIPLTTRILAVALMWRGLVLAKAVEQFLTDVRWGELDYLLVDMPPGTGDIQMALSRLLPRAELLVVTTPALAAQKVAVRVADMARRSYLKVAGVVENMSAFTCEHGESYALFGSGGGQALADEVKAPLLAQIPLEPGVASGGDTGSPLALAEPQSPAGQAFHLLAHRLATEIMPPVEMSGCTARVFAAANANLATLDAA